jgi:small subunit ribosomal protein S20
LAVAPPKKNLSVLKRARQSEKLNLRNTAVRSRLKTLAKKLNEAVDTKDKEKVEKTLREAVKAISSAASKGIIHKNTASRKISRLSKKADSVLKAEAA